MYHGSTREEERVKKKRIHAKQRKRGPIPNRYEYGDDYKFANEKKREESLMRHSWYRRKKEKEEALA